MSEKEIFVFHNDQTRVITVVVAESEERAYLMLAEAIAGEENLEDQQEWVEQMKPHWNIELRRSQDYNGPIVTATYERDESFEVY